MEILEFLLSFISTYGPLVSYFAALISRETSALLLSFLSSQGIIKFYTFFFFFYLGVLTFDLIIFFVVARSKFINKLMKFLNKNGKVKKISKSSNHFMVKNLFLSVVMAKFLYGTRFIMLLLLGKKKSNFPRVFYYDIILTFIWLSIISSIGWFAGKQFDSVMDTFKSLELTVTIFVSIFVFYYIVKIFVSRKIIRKLENITLPTNLIYKGKFSSSI